MAPEIPIIFPRRAKAPGANTVALLPEELGPQGWCMPMKGEWEEKKLCSKAEVRTPRL